VTAAEELTGKTQVDRASISFLLRRCTFWTISLDDVMHAICRKFVIFEDVPAIAISYRPVRVPNA
jgi:hypothetical protein